MKFFISTGNIINVRYDAISSDKREGCKEIKVIFLMVIITISLVCSKPNVCGNSS